MPMRLPRVRFTVRWLLIAVAVMGLTLGGWQMWRLRTTYLALASEHAGLEEGGRDTGRVCRENVVGLTGRGLAYLALGRWRDAWSTLTNAVVFIPEAVRQNRLADYRARMRRKYEHAANHPWIRISPDPPRPD